MTRVLVVDDLHQNRHVLHTILASNGYEVDEARHGADALTLAQRRPPQLVICDFPMPVMDGYPLLRQWKADEQLRHIPFVVCAATGADPGEEQLALDLGADAFIVKPIEPDRFLARIHELLAQEQCSDLVPAQEPETTLLHERNAILIRQLEKKVLALQHSNRELVASRQRVHSVIDNMADALIISSASAGILTANPAASEMFDYSTDELAGRPLALLLNGTVPEVTGIAPRHPQIYPQGGRRRSGTCFPVELTVSHFDSEREQISTIQIRDLTERWATEEKLRQLAGAVEAATVSIEILDANGAITYVNPASERQHGFRLAEIRGRRPSDLADYGVDEATYRNIFATVLSGERWSGLMSSKNANGACIDEETMITPIHGEDGTVNSYIVVRHDVTERRRLETRLQQAQKLEAIGQLAAGIAHEINTPTQYVSDNLCFLQDSFAEIVTLLSRISQRNGASENAWCDAIAKALEAADLEFLREEIPRALEQSIDGVSRIASIVRAMKEFSHPTEDKTATDLNRAIRSTLTVTTSEWKQVAEVMTDLDDKLPQVAVVPGEFNQVMLNLIVNAAHAIDEVVGNSGRKGRIGVLTARCGDLVEIRISDSGCGIAPENLTRIFVPFFTTKPIGKGTGQGLSFAWDVIVNRHDGSISVESTPGLGTTFLIRLPIEGER